MPTLQVPLMIGEPPRRALVPRLSAPAPRPTGPDAPLGAPCFDIRGLSVFYDETPALRKLTLTIPARRITAFIGPSGCGKSTLLRALNRMHDGTDGARIEGEVLFQGERVYAPGVDVAELRRRIGMVFQKPNPFPKSVYDNVAYGLRLHGIRDRSLLDEVVERSLRRAALWDEVQDRLREPAVSLSGGQQQRLVIARAIAIEPEVILLDEPCSALDPIATGRIEELMRSLAQEYTIVIVTHNMQQASRVSDYTAFLYLGELVEFGATGTIFTSPSSQQTEDYITGRFG